DTIPYEYLIAATEQSSYNSLVCTTFMPEYGRTNVYKDDSGENEKSESSTVASVGERSLFRKEISLNELSNMLQICYIFIMTPLTNQFTYNQYLAEQSTNILLVYVLKRSKQIYFYTQDSKHTPQPGDMIASLTPPDKEIKKIKQKIEANKT